MSTVATGVTHSGATAAAVSTVRRNRSFELQSQSSLGLPSSSPSSGAGGHPGYSQIRASSLSSEEGPQQQQQQQQQLLSSHSHGAGPMRTASLGGDTANAYAPSNTPMGSTTPSPNKQQQQQQQVFQSQVSYPASPRAER